MLVPSSNYTLVPDIAVLAYPATAHESELVNRELDRLRQRQLANPNSRLAAVACGYSSNEVGEEDIQDYVCSDGFAVGRYVARLVRPSEFRALVVDWLIATGSERSGGALPLSDADAYSPEGTIEEGVDEACTDYI